MDSLAALSREIEASGLSAGAATTSSAREYLRQKEQQRKEETPAILVAAKPVPQMSHYHSQIASSEVEKPRRVGKVTKRQKKAEKGANYKSRVAAKLSSKQDRRTKVKSAKRR